MYGYVCGGCVCVGVCGVNNILIRSVPAACAIRVLLQAVVVEFESVGRPVAGGKGSKLRTCECVSSAWTGKISGLRLSLDYVGDFAMCVTAMYVSAPWEATGNKLGWTSIRSFVLLGWVDPLNV